MDYERNTPPEFRCLVLLAGLPGTGKSTLGIALSRALGIPMLDKDTLKHTLLAADLSEAVAAATAYELFFALARDIVVTQGLSLILDSPAQFAGVVRRARAIAEEGGVPLKVIACRAEFETRQRRLAERPRLLSHLAADPTPDSAVAGRFAHLPPGTLWLDSGQPVARLVEIALPFLQLD